MRLGIDIGGTHTDGVLLNQGEVIAHNKIPTADNNLAKTILTTCQQLITGLDPTTIDHITLSTTLATNLITQHNHPSVGLILIPGAGLDPNNYSYSPDTKVISGSIDHRGQQVTKINHQEALTAISELVEQGIDNLAICGKFSTRNPQQELELKELIINHFPELKQVTLSHKLAGKLNYPRRVATTYLNNIVARKHKQFISAVKQGLAQLEIKAPLYLLKADGGTMPLTKAKNKPVQSINSGPAASIIGSLALTQPTTKTLALDIGGTTTDISLFTTGEPLFKPAGIEIDNYPTTIRGLYNQSLPYGGDSLVQVKKGELKVGPQRKGPAAALGGKDPTPTDALIILKEITIGDHKKARQALQPLADKLNLTVQQTATKIITNFCSQLHTKVNQLLTELKQQPVYTINQLLTDQQLNPTHLVVVGGPAQALAPQLAEEFRLPYQVPAQAKIANAIGAAQARVTAKATLYADTAKGYYTIPELGIREEIKAEFDLATASQLLAKELNNSLAQKEKIEITNQQSFNIVRQFRTVGQIIEVTAQIKPGITN
ncbi:hydantoinase/oxoprolinase family protein [Halanaerobaculum tunisiense]